MIDRQESTHNRHSPAHQRTWLALEQMTDYAAFQQLCDETLTAHWGYKIHPRGISARGAVRGQPDSWGHDELGKLCAFEYGTSPNWQRKLEDDLALIAPLDNFFPEVFVFCTNRFVSADAERECIAMVQNRYGWELRLFGQGDLAVPLDTMWQDIRQRFLAIDVEQHNWMSLLSACKEHGRKILKRYSGKYEPSLYIQREAEQNIENCYRGMVRDIQQGKTIAQFLAIVDQAGAGKTNMVLHLSQEYGKQAPVLVLPGSLTITDDHTLEREIVEAVGYPVDNRTYHAKVHELCQMAQRQGYPFVVIVEGINENSDPAHIRKAMEQLLIACQDYSLLLLVTCRDVAWPLLQSSTLCNFASAEQRQYSENGVVRLGLYNDDEFARACKVYFAHYLVNVELTMEAAQRLRSPLLLTIFAQVNLYCPFKCVSEVVDKELWSTFVEAKIDAIYESMEKPIRKQAIRQALEHIAIRMFQRNTSSLALKELTDIPHVHTDDATLDSLFVQFNNNGMLFEDTPETTSFLYETCLEYVISKVFAHAFETNSERNDVLTQIEECARSPRWRQVPLYLTEMVTEPASIIERVRRSNGWLAAQALRRVPSVISSTVGQQVIADLEERLTSRFTLDRSRAAHLLGLLDVRESKDKLLYCWSTYGSEAALRALARLGEAAVVEPFILLLGRHLEWYFPQDQELVNVLPEGFRQQLIQEAFTLLNDAEHMFAAAHMLGYLKSGEAVIPLRSHLVTTEWCDWVALSALLRIGTQEAFTVLETALGEIGERLLRIDQHRENADSQGDGQEQTRSLRNELFDALDHLRGRGFQHCRVHEIAPFLTRLLDHPNVYVQHVALQSLKHLGAHETAFAIVQSAQHDTTGWIHREINEALYAFGRQIAVEPFLTLLNDSTMPDAVVRATITALGVSRDSRVIEPLAVFVRQHRFLFDVIQALGNTRLPAAIPLLVHMLEDTTLDCTIHGSLSRENLENMVIINLGKLQHPDAFEPVAFYIRQNFPTNSYTSIHALAASGGERAIPLLSELWQRDSEKRDMILRALLWIGTGAATNKILELLTPFSGEQLTLLVKALSRGRGLDLITGTIAGVGVLQATDERFIPLIDTVFEDMSPDVMLQTLVAMKYIATPQARTLLKRVVNDPRYDIPRPGSSPDAQQTLRDVALLILCDIGDDDAIHPLLDTLAHQPAHVIEFRLAKMDYGVVKEVIRQRLPFAQDEILIRLLTLLGTFGDGTILPYIQLYMNHSKQEVADAAYEAEQRILGVAYM